MNDRIRGKLGQLTRALDRRAREGCRDCGRSGEPDLPTGDEQFDGLTVEESAELSDLLRRTGRATGGRDCPGCGRPLRADPDPGDLVRMAELGDKVLVAVAR